MTAAMLMVVAPGNPSILWLAAVPLWALATEEGTSLQGRCWGLPIDGWHAGRPQAVGRLLVPLRISWVCNAAVPSGRMLCHGPFSCFGKAHPLSVPAKLE